MLKRFRWIIPWLIGALAATVLFAGLVCVGSLRYENSDDMLFVKGFLGFEGGEPVSFTLYTHTFLAWALHFLSSAVPGTAWFSLFQLGLLWLSAAVIVKCAIRLGRWKGFLGGCLYLGVFAAFACARLSYTTTAALSGAAAVMQLMEYDRAFTRFQRVSCLFWACAMFLLSYSLRQMVALPVLAYCLLALCLQGAKRLAAKTSIRPVITAAVVLCGLLLVFAGVREIEITARGQRDTLTWQKSRIELFDYTSFETDITPAMEAESGLSDLQTQMVQQWCFWDTDVDAEAFQTMTKAYANEEKAGVLTKLAGFLRTNPRYVCAVALLLLALAWVALGDESLRFKTLAAFLALAGGLIMLLYLCWRGRVLFRGLDTVFFPCAALMLALICTTRPRKKALAAVLAAAMVLLCGADGLFTLDQLRETPDWVSQQRESEFETYALRNPDFLVIRTPNLLRDTRLLPDVSSGLPVNTAIWGDWYCRMPGWHAQLTRYGFNSADFHFADWVDGPILFATADAAPPQLLLDTLSESAGRTVNAQLHGTEGTLSFFSFH